MRNLAPGPKFSVLVAAVVVITLAVWPIGYAQAEKISAEGQKEKRNAEEGGISLKHQRYANLAEKPPIYQKWETGTDVGDDDAYSGESDPSGSSSYEDDGYGYDDDDYDHFNYKRYDNDKSKLNEDMKMNNEENKETLASDKRGNVVVPEATTIELLSFQAKNMNPMAENAQQQKDDSKMKQFSMKKPPYSDKTEEKESLVEEKLKKKTSEDQKPDGNANDKNTGNVKVAENKVSETKDSTENKGEKGKISDAGTTGSTSVHNPKESPQVAEDKENSASVSDGKNEAKMAEKDLKNAEAKFQQEEKNSVKMKGEKESETRVDEAKVDEEAAKDESKEKYLSHLEGNPVQNDYKDEFENMNEAVVGDDEKDSEDNGMNLAGLRDSRNELPYQYPNGFPSQKFIKRKDRGRRVAGALSGSRNSKWASKALERESEYRSGAKEPFHLEFPASDLENTDHRRNYLKTLQRFKNLGESAGILGQGDTPSPYADEAKKYLAPKVIEEEQRKRRSRLRRLKANPVFTSIKKRGREEEEEEDAYDYGSPPRARMHYGMYTRNILGEGYGQPSATKSYRRRGSHLLRDTYSGTEELEEEGTRNIKNKREDDSGFYAEEDETYAEKRKSQGKSAWGGGENHKKKLKEANLYEEPSQYNTPLVLLQRNDNGEQAMKTFVDGRYKNEEGVDSEDLARLLSRDSNYVVLRKVPAKEEALRDNGDSNRDKFQITHLDLTMKAQHPSNVKEPDAEKLVETLKEGHGEHSLKGKENRIEDLSDFFKGDAQDDRDLDEKKEMLMSIDNRLSQYQRGEPDKSVLYKPSLSQAYRHMKDLDEPENLSDSGINMIRIADKSTEKNGIPERLLKSFKKDGKEFLVIDRGFGGMAVKGKSQDGMMQNVANPLGLANVVPNVMGVANGAPMASIAANRNIGQVAKVFPNGMKMTGISMMPSNMYQNAMLPSNSFQEIKLPEVQKGRDSSRKYFLYGSENDMSNAPKHEIKVIQGSLSLPPDTMYNSQNYNQQYFNSQNYNKASSMKNSHGGKAQPLKERKVDEYAMVEEPYGYGKTQECSANSYQEMSPLGAVQGFKKVAKKDKSSGDLERFMRDFQDFSQASYPNTYKSTDLPGMTLQELTGHGDRHLQKLNNLLKEIMSNKAEEKVNSRAVKNLKRGMFQKYKDEKSWPATGRGGEAQVRSGKWTSLVYDDGSRQAGYSDKSNSHGDSSIKDRKLEGKDATAMLNKDNLSSKRSKRQSGYDSKDSTKILEQKVKSTPYIVQPQPLFPNSNANANSNTNQQHKSPTKACLQLPPDKLMDLLNFFRSEREEFDIAKNSNECLCRRNAPAQEKPCRRKLLSVSEKESLNEIEQKKAECVRKSFESYLDPLVRKMGEYEMRTVDRSRRSSVRGKREIELDESMPNDFQNFLVTSVGSFGSQKRGVVKKDEAVWDSEGSREESALGKRDTSGSTKTEKKSVSKEDATNIRIKIVDGNGNEEVGARASEGTGDSKEVKASETDSNADPSIHEVYLITSADSKGRKKKKFASIRSDQSPQKQPISNHLPQVETVYNPSPGSNKAQVEKISGDTQVKGKCAQPTTVYNATASMMEDNIIRNNLRTGNINTFTYQHKEEPTPYPLQGPTNPPSSEFEMLNSKSLSRTKPFSNRVYDNGDHYAASGVGNTNAEIIYKDQNPQEYTNGASSRPGYHSNTMVRVFKSGTEGSAADRYRKDYADEESAYAEYEDGESFSDEISERQADQDYEEQDSGRQGYRRQDMEDYSKAQEHLDPKMVALWNDYARTHLSPERHKEAMEREFEEAYFRSSGQTRYVGGNLNQPNLGVNLIQNLRPNDLERLDKQKTREKLSKRFAKPPEPLPIGQRFFYTFKSEVPDEEYYSLYQSSSNMKSSSDNARTTLTDNAEKSGVGNRQLEEVNVGAKRNSDDFQVNRVKRSEGRTKAMEQSKVDKRLSSGRSTENRYQKYHKKNLNLKGDGKAEEDEEGRQGGERGKRDSLADFLKADMMRRIEEEKKIRSKVKGLSSDLTKYDIPLIGGSSPGEEIPLPDLLLQRLEEEKKKEKNMDRDPYLEDQQQQQQQHQPFHFGNLKSGNPDVFKTFEIKRGRREDGGSRAEGGRHAIVSRAGSTTYHDRVFLKGVNTRKVKKYSNEGFEPLRPDARFSEKSGLYSEASKASDENERGSSSINRRAGDKRAKLKETGAGGQQKLQKLTHGFSHEAPLLTAASPLNSPKIFDALKDAPPPKEAPSLHKYPADASLLAPPDMRDRSHLKSSKSSAAAKEPLVSAVLVLTKRENPRERGLEREYPAQTSFRLPSSEEEDERGSRVENRKGEWVKGASGELSRFRPPAQSPEIVNEGADSRGSECETPAKTVTNQMVHNVKQSCFPFRQLNKDRNGGGTGIGNSGEDILESILATVESNPHFRKVIGPGLKWRGRKCKTEAESLQEIPCQQQNRGPFVRQVRKILARFVKDIEALASQDFPKNVCSKLDSNSNKFLHELLDVPYEGVGTCKRRKYLGSLLREPSGSGGRSNIADEDSPLNVAEAEAQENRRDLVARLLEEYRSLPDEEKRSVQVLGHYLNHELKTLNKALNRDGLSPARSGGKHEGRAMPAASAESGETNTEKAGITSDTTQEREKDPTLASGGAPRLRSNPKNLKSVKDNCGTNFPPSSVSMTHVPSPKESTERSNTGVPYESAESATSSRTEDVKSYKERKDGGLDKLGYGDAAALHHSLTSRALWLSNLNLSKGKSVHASRMAKQHPVTDFPFPDE